MHAIQGTAGRLIRGCLTAAALAACAGADTAGCGGGDAREQQQRPAAHRIDGVPLQQARCRNWEAAPARERAAAIAQLKVVVGGRTQAGPAQTLSPGEATRLFDRTCRARVADGFLLYELYIRAAGFRSFSKAPV